MTLSGQHPAGSDPGLKSMSHTLEACIMEHLLPPNKACGLELTQCLRIMCGPKNCSGPLLPVLGEAPPRSGVMRASTFSPFPNVGQTWTIVHSMPTSYQPIGLCLDFLPLAYLAFSQCGPDMLNLCHLIVPATKAVLF